MRTEAVVERLPGNWRGSAVAGRASSAILKKHGLDPNGGQIYVDEIGAKNWTAMSTRDGGGGNGVPT